MKYLEESTRPWGNYQKLYKDETIWVKRVNVNPKGRLSLQKHRHRSETWIITAGQGLVVVDKKKIPVKKGSVINIPLGAVHRIGNTGKKPLVFVEVAFGKHLTEEDIIRLQDDYAR